ncbi:MAG: hypothetical protein JNM66_13810 [Bryobacterales bacterium]|nr:hypothetical protein [Bryobacterales bacterium]
MRQILHLFILGTAIAAAADNPRAYIGVITDSMCGAKHTMGIRPDDKCVRECIKNDPKKWKYALLVGTEVYVLSDQQTPEKFAGQKVKVTGTLYAKTKILKTAKIEAVR